MENARLLNLLGCLTVALSDELQQSTAAIALPSAAAAIVTLNYYPRSTIQQLSVILGLTSSGTVRLIDRLALDALIERHTASDDRRSVVLTLTPQGQARAQAILSARRNTLASAIERLSCAEQSQLEAALEKMLATLTRDRDHADRFCRLCEVSACPQHRCPVEMTVS